MINEFHGGRRRVFMVNPQKAGRLDLKDDTHAADYYALPDGDTHHHPAPARSLRNTVRQSLEQTFLPAGYPASAAPDLSVAAQWEAAQTLCGSAAATVATRALLLQTGMAPGAATSLATWALQECTRLLAGVAVSARLAAALEGRAKLWHLLAEACVSVTLCGRLGSLCFPPAPQPWRGAALRLASGAALAQAALAVLSAGAKASLTLHFARTGNAADVTAKAAARERVCSLAGLFIGLGVSGLLPTASAWPSAAVSLLVACAGLVLRVYCCYRSLHHTVLTSLSAPLLEWCMAQTTGHGGPAAQDALVDISPTAANKAESLVVLPAARCDLPEALRWALARMGASGLSVDIRFGVSLFELLQNGPGLGTRAKQDLVFGVEECLSARGVALVYDEVRNTYGVVLPETYMPDGCPLSWAAYRPAALAAAQGAPYAGAKFSVEAPEARVRKQLWAYYYAYHHQRARRCDRDGAVVRPPEALYTPLVLVRSLSAEGVLDLRRQHVHHGADPAATPDTYGTDTLYPDFLRFMEALTRAGWDLSRLPVPNEGWTVAVHYL